MIYLLLSIIFTSSLIILFKYFDRFKVNILPAIVINYFVAATIGLIHAGGLPESGISNVSWLKIALPLGVLFVSVFYTIALTTKALGVSAATIANKMSVIIPVIFAFYLYGDSVSPLKITGIVLALAAVYFANKKDGSQATTVSYKKFILPFIVFVGSGIIDGLVNYVQQVYLKKSPPDMFLTISFYSAGITGSFILAYQYLVKKKKPEWKSLLAGICLGIPNYFSIYFLIIALNKSNLESSVIYPINNIGIVVLSTLYSLSFFKEKLTRLNWIGIGLAIASILFMNFA